MVRVGKWDEQKVLFKNIADGGHGHTGGVAGSRLADGAINSSVTIATSCILGKQMGTSCLKYWTGFATVKKFWAGTVTKGTGGGASMNWEIGGATWGFTSFDWVEMWSTTTALGAAAGTQVVSLRELRVGPSVTQLVIPTAIGVGAGDYVYAQIWGE